MERYQDPHDPIYLDRKVNIERYSPKDEAFPITSFTVDHRGDKSRSPVYRDIHRIKRHFGTYHLYSHQRDILIPRQDRGHTH